MNPGILLLLKKNWKIVLFTILISFLLIIGIGFLFGSIGCPYLTGITSAMKVPGFGNAGGDKDDITSPESTVTPGPASISGDLEEDCATQIIRKANPSVSLQEAKNYVKWANQYGSENNISPALLLAQIWKESTFNKNAVSSSNAKGLAQFLPAAWQDAGNLDPNGNGSDPFDPQDNIASQAAYFNKVRSYLKPSLRENIKNILAGYYVGAGTVNKYNGVPPDKYEGTLNTPTSYVNKILNEFYPPFQKCLGGSTIPTSEKGKKIILHWTAGGYDSPSSYYHYNIKGDGSITRGLGNKHALNRSHDSIGVTVCAGWGDYDSNKYPSDDVLGTKTFYETPIKQIQYDTMISLVAKLAKDNNIPVDRNHIMSHAEAASMKDYSKDLVKQVSNPNQAKCTNTLDDKKAIKLGLPHCNYGPSSWKDGWPGGCKQADTRWEYWEHEDQIRADIKAKMGI